MSRPPITGCVFDITKNEYKKRSDNYLFGSWMPLSAAPIVFKSPHRVQRPGDCLFSKIELDRDRQIFSARHRKRSAENMLRVSRSDLGTRGKPNSVNAGSTSDPHGAQYAIDGTACSISLISAILILKALALSVKSR